MMKIVQRLQSAWRRHGLAGFVLLCLKNALYQVRRITSGRFLENESIATSQVDRDLGIETSAVREVGSLLIESPNARFAVRYQPSPQEIVTKLISELPIDHRLFSFVDFGAGKGLVLVLASHWPFSNVVGVEFAGELCQIANRNLAAQDPKRVATAIACVHADAASFNPPDGPLVCYFYNPFGESIMRTVAERLSDSAKSLSREVWVIYVHPEHRQVFGDRAAWSEVERSDFHAVFRSRALI